MKKLSLIITENCRKANNTDEYLIRCFLRGKHFEKILDTGCGDGAFSREVSFWTDAKEIYGIDLIKP